MKKAVAQVPANLGLYIAGHSLGGALAQIAAASLSEMDNLAACYTFGSPRVATLGFDTPGEVPALSHCRQLGSGPGRAAALLVKAIATPAIHACCAARPRARPCGATAISFPAALVDLWSLLLWPLTGQISSVNDHMIWIYRRKLEFDPRRACAAAEFPGRRLRS